MRRRLIFAAKWGTLVGLVLTLVAVGGFIYLYRATDIPDPNDEFETQTSFVYYSDDEGEQGAEIGKYAVQNRESIAYSEMPDAIKEAVVAAENRSFWTDKGIDPKGIVRAFFNNAAGNAQQGASTITQQYVKILYLTQERSYTRKVKEAILSLKLVRQQSKQQILEGYLNTIYFGRGAYGVQAAAKAFFDKPAADLNLRESAVLASVINNPSRFDPDNGKDARLALKERYRFVLSSMVEVGSIDADEGDKAAKRLPKFNTPEVDDAYGGQNGHMLTMVKNELVKLTNEKTGEPFTEEEINGGGLRVTTTFTEKAMTAAAQGVAEQRPEGKEFGDRNLHVGVASVEPGTGAVRGFYGGQDFLKSQINWAVAGGQAGSSLKPFAVAAGIKQGFELKDTFEGNSPLVISPTLDFENQGNQDYGRVSLLKATEDSVNTAFIDLTMGMNNGPEAIVKQANLMGIPSKNGKSDGPGFPSSTPGLEPQLGVALGSATVSPINMANGYATIANGGRAAQAYIIERVTDAGGEELYSHQVQDKSTMSEDIASDVSYALQQVVKSGSGTAALALGRPAAGKTGTSTNGLGDVVSAWFTGYTPQLATSVVYVRGKGVGKLDGWLPSFFGGAYPARTWTAVMERDMEGLESESFPPPAYVTGDAPTSGHDPAPPKPTKTPKPTETPSETPSESSSPTKTPKPSPTPTAEPTPTDTSQPCGILQPCPSDSATPTQSGTPTSQPSDSASQAASPGGNRQTSVSARSAQPLVTRSSWWMLVW
ncbi:transglycosylase domain-containing protein [Nocardioides sp.]|uniref:transglycosylase domain-containing protein n=1 Tax=Nocardioides sp. TaxID=35761 RepID=UPI0035645B5C